LSGDAHRGQWSVIAAVCIAPLQIKKLISLRKRSAHDDVAEISLSIRREGIAVANTIESVVRQSGEHEPTLVSI
jgi:hypothetical protein